MIDEERNRNYLINRYSRQIAFGPLGAEGQSKLAQAKVAVIGAGALGSVIINNLARAGVGFLRIVDRDFVEASNLQRQVIYNENDAFERLPKVIAAAEYIEKVNSGISIDPIVADCNAGNAENIADGMDIIVDGTDNFETRLLLNDVCLKHDKPWVFGSALGAYGMSMAILPKEGPCFRCLIPNVPPAGSQETCNSAGVLNMISGIIGCYESAEAIKLLTSPQNVAKKLFIADIWYNSFDVVDVEKKTECPACCLDQYDYLSASSGNNAVILCGSNAVQITPAQQNKIDLLQMREKLSVESILSNKYILRFKADDYEISLFQDGRAIIEGTSDVNKAKALYFEYIGG